MATKYRVIWNTVTKDVESVIEDQGGTITNYPDENREYAVVDGLVDLSAILVSQGYNVAAIDDYQSNNQ